MLLSPEVSEAMLKNMTSQTHADGNMQIVALPEGESANHSKNYSSGTLVPAVGGATVEYKGGESAIKPLDDEDLEVKLRRISEQVPVRISNTSGSSAGSGSGDFHQYRQMRRREQDRVHRMEIDYQKRMGEREFHQRREERLREAEERTAKKRALRQKKKESKKLKKSRLGPAPADSPLPSVQPQPLTNNTEENQPSDGNRDSDDGDNELTVEQERLGAPITQLVAGGSA